MSALNSLRIALIQMKVSDDKAANVRKAVQQIHEAKSKGSSLVVLPECFNCPYGTKYFPKFAEPVPNGETCKALCEAAKSSEVYLVGGSIPEVEAGKFYNTSTVWDPQGKLVAKHRKVHLFDIEIPGGITFRESDVLSPGNEFTVFSTNKCKVGLGICYDIRFPEMTRLYRKAGVDMLIYPGAFNMTTGPMHWELLMRARANDEHVFVAAVSPAQDLKADYVAWGHSMVVDPWGKVIKQAEFQEETVIADLDLSEVHGVRQKIPCFKQRRTDLYDTLDKKSQL